MKKFVSDGLNATDFSSTIK